MSLASVRMDVAPTPRMLFMQTRSQLVGYLRIPAFSARASRTQSRRLTVTVNPIGGTVSNIVLRIRSRRGGVLGTGTLTRASSERAVAVRLKSPLNPGRYVATASGRDLFADVVTARPREFRLR